MPVKMTDKQFHDSQMVALRAQYPLVYDLMLETFKRIRKLEIQNAKQQTAIRTLEEQVQPAFAEHKRKEHEDE